MVNSLWLLFETTALTYRYAEIREGGYLVNHVEQPLIIDHQDPWQDEVTFQKVTNCWASEGLGQNLMDTYNGDRGMLGSRTPKKSCKKLDDDHASIYKYAATPSSTTT